MQIWVSEAYRLFFFFYLTPAWLAALEFVKRATLVVGSVDFLSQLDDLKSDAGERPTLGLR